MLRRCRVTHKNMLNKTTVTAHPRHREGLADLDPRRAAKTALCAAVVCWASSILSISAQRNTETLFIYVASAGMRRLVVACDESGVSSVDVSSLL